MLRRRNQVLLHRREGYDYPGQIPASILVLKYFPVLALIRDYLKAADSLYVKNRPEFVDLFQPAGIEYSKWHLQLGQPVIL